MEENKGRKRTTWVVVGVAVFFIGLLLMQFVQDPNAQFVKNLEKERTDREEFFKSSGQSPLSDSGKAVFEGLNYFKPNAEYSFVADFIPNESYALIELSRFGGQPETYVLAGKLEFEFEGSKHFLTAYRQKTGSSKDLFVPFKDLTAGKTTYGGGRYLDLRLIIDEVHLDFNRAYNPFCVFNPMFVCPIPPEENHLDIEIPVGEKIYN